MNSRPAGRWALIAAGLVVITLVAAYAGWQLLDNDATAAPDSALSDQCDDVPHGAERITLTAADGARLGGAVIGQQGAEVGVVLRQGAGQTICQWLDWAQEVSDQTGARVVLFDRRGRGSSPGPGDLGAEPGDVLSAIAMLNRQGTTHVALAASSMGNSVMFTALDRLASPPCAVLSISPVLTAVDDQGTVDGSRMERLPPNVWVTWESQNSAIAANADLIVDRVREQHLPDPHLLAVDTMDHSIALVNKHPEVRDFLADALRSCQGPK